jgi:hypothetical protein
MVYMGTDWLGKANDAVAKTLAKQPTILGGKRLDDTPKRTAFDIILDTIKEGETVRYFDGTTNFNITKKDGNINVAQAVEAQPEIKDEPAPKKARKVATKPAETQSGVATFQAMLDEQRHQFELAMQARDEQIAALTAALVAKPAVTAPVVTQEAPTGKITFKVIKDRNYQWVQFSAKPAKNVTDLCGKLASLCPGGGRFHGQNAKNSAHKNCWSFHNGEFDVVGPLTQAGVVLAK